MPRQPRLALLVVSIAVGMILLAAQSRRSDPTYTPVDAGARLIADVAYDGPGETAHPAHRLDVYLPAEPVEPMPAVVWIHGGGWVAGDKSDPMGPADWTDDGVAVVAVNYRLGPGATIGDAVSDVRAALAHVRRSAGAWGLDPERIGLYGHSAGGHLVAMVAASDEPLAGVVVAGAPLDLVALIDGNGSAFVGLEGAEVVDFVSRALGCVTVDSDCRSSAEAMSPALLPNDESPVLVIHGDADRFVPVDHARAYAEAHGDEPPTTVSIVPGADHEFFAAEAREFLLPRLLG